MCSHVGESITGTALKKVLLNYFPKELTKDVDLSKLVSSCPENIANHGFELLQKFVQVSNDDIRMYGTAEDLVRALYFHRHFTSSHRFFGIDIAEAYNYEPKLLQHEGGSFICKQDLFVQLGKHISENAHKIRLCRSVITIYLKTCEERLKGCCEYVKYDTKFIEKLLAQHIPVTFDECLPQSSPQNFNFEDIFNEWKTWIPGWTDKQYAPIRKALQTHFDTLPFLKNFTDYYATAVSCKYWLGVLRKTITAHPEYFLPATPTTIKRVPTAVRIFDLTLNKFVMKAELFKALKLIYPSSNKWDFKDKEGYVEVMSIVDVEKQYANLLSNVQFIKWSRKSTEVPVPIMTPTGDYCVLSAEAFQHIVNHLGLLLKVFQKVKKDSWHVMKKYMKWLEKELTIDALSPDFVAVSKLKHIEVYTSEFFKDYKNVPAKIIRSVQNTFNADDLQKELRYLGLREMLPDIEDYADCVYNLMIMCKNTNILSTSDLFSAVGQCQFKSIMQIFPKVFLKTRHFALSSSESEDDKPTPKVAPSKNKKPEKKERRTNKLDSIPTAEFKNILEKAMNSETIELPEFEHIDKRGLILELGRVNLLNKTLKDKNELLEEKNIRKTDENEQLKLKNTALKNDYEPLKSKLSKYENNETKRKDSNARLNESNQQLTKLISTLESQLKDEQRKVQKVERASKQKEIDFNKEIKRVKREFSENNKNVVAIKTELDSLADFNSQCVKTNAEHLSRIEALERDFDDNKGIIEFLQREVSTKTDQINIEEAKHARTIAEFNDTKHEIEEKINQLELLLEKEKQRTQELAQGMVPQLQKLAGGQIDLDLEQEIFDIKSANNQLQDTNTRLAVQVEQQTLIIKAFFEHVGHIEKSYSSSSSQTTPEEFTTGYTGVKHHLWSLQKIKDSFRNGKQLKQAKDMVEKLITLCNNQPDIHEMINYEFQQYEAQLHHYLQSIEVNIQKIKKTGECTHLDPIPNLPMFSDRFLKEYWKHISESEVSENSPKDSECLICLVEMTLEEKTMKCENCRKVLHLECASEWLKRHRSCPHCRRELLDPNEFPPLL